MQIGDAKRASKIRTSFVFTAILACLMMAPPRSASAAIPSVLRVGGSQGFTGLCCILYNETVGLTEGATLRPVLVLWSTGYSLGLNDESEAGLSVNGGACNLTFGSNILPDYDLANDPGAFIKHITFQWVVLPADGVLKTGVNTFELCGGGVTQAGDSITIYTNTLSAQFVP